MAIWTSDSAASTATTTNVWVTGVQQARIWRTWTGTAAYSFPQDVIWKDWVGTSTSATTMTLTRQDAVWEYWNNTVYFNTPQGPVYPQLAEPTQEELDRRQAERERQSRERLACERQVAQANDRALELLEMVLTTEEKLYRELNDKVMVRGSDGHMYVLETGHTVHGNISRVDEHGCKLGRVCVQPDMYDREARAAIPIADGWVGQYLGLKHNAEEFLSHGNWSMRRECQQPGVPILERRAA